MKVVYNGIEMHMLELHSYSRNNVYTEDRADVLAVRHHLNMSVVVGAGGHPHGMAHKRLSDNDARLKPEPRRTGFRGHPKLTGQLDNTVAYGASVDRNPWAEEWVGATDRVLVPLLMTPRQKLKITAYRPKEKDNDASAQEMTWLESPRLGQVVDVMNGPHPLGCTMTEPTGDAPGSAVLNFQIETHLPLAETDDARAIISHRWTSTLQHDDDFYATRVVSGEAVFDQGLLHLFNQNASDFLNQLYHPIPLGYQRGLPEVTLSSDGAQLRYTFTDTAVRCVFDAGQSGATQCWIDENWTYTSPAGDALGAVLGVGSAAKQAVMGKTPIASGKGGLWKNFVEGAEMMGFLTGD